MQILPDNVAIYIQHIVAYTPTPALMPVLLVAQITIVGKVVELVEQQLQLTLRVDDGTGVVDVKYWIEVDNDMVRTLSFLQ